MVIIDFFKNILSFSFKLNIKDKTSQIIRIDWNQATLEVPFVIEKLYYWLIELNQSNAIAAEALKLYF